MTRIFLDNELRSKLLDLREPLELCDSAGQVVGRLFPNLDSAAYGQWEPHMDEAELQRREQSNAKRYTTAQVLAHLEKLGNS